MVVAPGTESAAMPETAGYMQATALEWKAEERALLRQPRLRALRDALFAESSRKDSGRIQFRFRLERKP